MKKDVVITIKSKQTLDGNADAMELITSGRLTSHGKDGYLLSYQESPVTGLEDTRCTFRVEPNRVSLVRTGKVNSNLVFELGRTHTSIYSTPMGSLEVGVTAKRIENRLCDTGGQLKVDYAIDFDHQIGGYHQFDIQVRAV